jgi:hypothetical protein
MEIKIEHDKRRMLLPPRVIRAFTPVYDGLW